jgi:hypothetical protein
MARHALPRTLMLIALLSPMIDALAQGCAVRSGPTPATVVELYTSEGCNSCPPADRWLSTLPPAPGLIALAFHVDYWDHLGWNDRFASKAYSQRQAKQQSVNGSRYSYTPQVVVNGRDRKDWPTIRPTPLAATPVEITLSRDGALVHAAVRAPAAARLAAYWAVTEMGHSSAVRAGENAGVLLKHDHVVRELLDVPAWRAPAGGTTQLQFRPGTTANPVQPRQINFVVLDADTGRPVQALKLGC